MRLNHYYSADYLSHIRNITESDMISFNSEDSWEINLFVKKTSKGVAINSVPFYGSHGGIKSLSPSFDSYNLSQKDREQIPKVADLVFQHNPISLTIIENPFQDEKEKILNQYLFKILDKKVKLTFQQTKRIGYIKSVTNIKTNEDLLMSYHSKTRNCVKKWLKSEKLVENVSITNSNFDHHLDWLWRNHYIGISKKGGIPKPQLFFTSLKESYDPHRFQLLIAKEQSGEIIAGLLNFITNKTIEYWTPVVTTQGQKYNAIYGLIHSSMLYMIREKLEFFNFGGTWPSQESLARFKKRFGSEEKEYSYYTWYNKDFLSKIDNDLILNEWPFYYIKNFD